MTDIKLSNNGTYVSLCNDTIYIGVNELEMIRLNKLTDEELINFTTDLIIHEQIHLTLFKTFDKSYYAYIISTLFDTIEHLICDNVIARKVFGFIWLDIIDKFGLTWVYNYYNINTHDITNARKTANLRLPNNIAD